MIHVLVPAYNCMEFLPRCLDSLAQQSGEFRVLVIDDASTDPTQAPYIQAYCENKGWGFQINEENRKCPRNLWDGVARLDADENDVCFLLDGDDWLPHSGSLSRINEEYQLHPECLLTYGSYTPYPSTGGVAAYDYPDWVAKASFYRFFESAFNHPITFRVKLWQQLSETDFQFEDGRWYDSIYDECIMFPLLELAQGNYRFISDDLYSYNGENALSEFRILDNTDVAMDLRDRQKPKVPVRLPDNDNLNDMIHLVCNYGRECVEIETHGVVYDEDYAIWRGNFFGYDVETDNKLILRRRP